MADLVINSHDLQEIGMDVLPRLREVERERTYAAAVRWVIPAKVRYW